MQCFEAVARMFQDMQLRKGSPIREEGNHAVQGVDVGTSGQNFSVELVQLHLDFRHPAPASGIYDGCCNGRQDDSACPQDNGTGEESHGCCTGRSSASAGLLIRPGQALGCLSEEMISLYVVAFWLHMDHATAGPSVSL